ncbi:hypothetical protein TD95_000174 [Thielaviopsis punctulata]|uniref:26S proteasome complex subunit SEM1 n=1 Tax=Thielaviopsis punctulata TaxID=72032 RepID=A0A0F4ZDP1_9PEZI|nr:hypothetical protein TD95_000174 [Thielaviopsis punctulata]
MAAPPKSTSTPADASSAAAANALSATSAAASAPAVVGEDDEFEDFPADDWAQEETEAANGSATTQHLWEESWDDNDTSDDFSTQLKATTPGRALPSSSSREAPPPVDTWLSLLSTPYLAATVAVSPPPIMTILPASQAATAASRVALVPLANLSISKTPHGPFHRMVADSLMVDLNSSTDLGPQSRPIQLSGMPSESEAAPVLAVGEKSSAVTKSTGRTTLTLFFLAFSIRLATFLLPASSKSEVPMGML